MRVIFLDIDGVLNNLKDAHEESPLTDRFALDFSNWNPHALRRLNDLCKATGAKVVISSSWRKLQSDPAWWNEQFVLNARCPDIEVIGITGDSHNGFRGREVNDWLAKHPEVERYVIIDDESDFYPDQPRIHTDMYYGFTARDMLNAIKVLYGWQDGLGNDCMEERNPK